MEFASVPIVMDTLSKRYPIAIQTLIFLRKFFSNPIYVLSDGVFDTDIDNVFPIQRKKDFLPLGNVSRFTTERQFETIILWMDDLFLVHADMDMIQRFFEIFMKEEKVGFFKLYKRENKIVGKQYDKEIFIASKKMRWYVNGAACFAKRDFLSFIAAGKFAKPWEQERVLVRRARKYPSSVMHTTEQCFDVFNFIKRGYVYPPSYEFAKDMGFDFSDMDLRLYSRANYGVYRSLKKKMFGHAKRRIIKLSRKRKHRDNERGLLYRKAAKLIDKKHYKKCMKILHKTHIKCEW